jgi:hypothetical protein
LPARDDADFQARAFGGLLGRGHIVVPNGGAEQSPASRYANCKFIWSHAVGALIGVASRVVGPVTEKDLSGTPPVNSRLYHIRRFFYDTAGSANPILMQGIAKLAGVSQIVFGTDYPFGNGASQPRACGRSASLTLNCVLSTTIMCFEFSAVSIGGV